MTLTAINSKKRHRCAPLIIFLASFALYSFIAYCSPFTSDDYEFSAYSFSFSELLNYVLHYGNGRFLGNISTLLIINNRFAQVVVKAAMMSSIIVLIPKVLGTTSPLAYLSSLLLFVGMSPRIVAQTFTWTSGFNNYTPPIFLSLLILYLFQMPRFRQGKYPLLLFPLVFLLGVSSQLYSEHTTITNICLAFFVLIHALRQKTHHVSLAVTWLTSALIGALIMFAIPRIFYVADNYSEGYRQLHMNGLFDCISTAVENFSTLTDYLLANKLAIALAAVTAVTAIVKHSMIGRLKGAITVFGVFFAGYFFFLEGTWVGEWQYLRKILSIAMPLSLIAGALWVIASASGKRMLHAVLCILFLSSTAPLLFVSPLGERCLLLGYSFFVSMILLGVHSLQCEISQSDCRYVKTVIIAVICTISLAVCTLFCHIHSVTVMLHDHIDREMAQGSNVIQVFNTPYNYTFGCMGEHFERCYFRNEWGDVEFIVINMDEWMAQYGHND